MIATFGRFWYLPFLPMLTERLEADNDFARALVRRDEDCEVDVDEIGGPFTGAFLQRLMQPGGALFSIFTVACVLGLDWMNPFRKGKYSLCPVWLLFLSLPEAMRYKLKYQMMCMIIPGPKSPKHLAVYLRLLVDDLMKHFAGIYNLQMLTIN